MAEPLASSLEQIKIVIKNGKLKVQHKTLFIQMHTSLQQFPLQAPTTELQCKREGQYYPDLPLILVSEQPGPFPKKLRHKSNPMHY